MRLQIGRATGAALLALLSTGVASGQGPSAALPYAIPGHGSLRLSVPTGWRVSSKALTQPPSLNLRFGPSSGDSFSLQVTAVWLDADKLANTTQASLKATASRSAEGPLRQAVEKTVVIQDLRGAQSAGFYFSLTDRAPPPSEYKYLTQGTYLTGEVMVVFTLLHREMPSPEKEQAIRMLTDSTHSK